MNGKDESSRPVTNVSPANDWISPLESDRRLETVERLTALEEKVSALENRRDENKWWIRTTILLASAVGITASAVIVILNRWLP